MRSKLDKNVHNVQSTEASKAQNVDRGCPQSAVSIYVSIMLAITSSEKPSLLSPEMENSVPLCTVAFHTTVTQNHFCVARRHGHLIYVPAPYPDPTWLTL